MIKNRQFKLGFLFGAIILTGAISLVLAACAANATDGDKIIVITGVDLNDTNYPIVTNPDTGEEGCLALLAIVSDNSEEVNAFAFSAFSDDPRLAKVTGRFQLIAEPPKDSESDPVYWTGNGSYFIILCLLGENNSMAAMDVYYYTNGKEFGALGIDDTVEGWEDDSVKGKLPKYNITQDVTTIPISKFRKSIFPVDKEK